MEGKKDSENANARSSKTNDKKKIRLLPKKLTRAQSKGKSKTVFIKLIIIKDILLSKLTLPGIILKDCTSLNC